MRSLRSRVRILHRCLSLADCASTLEKNRSQCQSCSPALTLRASGPALRTTPQLDVTILIPALIALGRKYLVDRGNSLGLQLSVCHLHLGLSGILKIAHPLLKSTDPSAHAFASELPRLLHTSTLKPRDFFSGDTSAECDRLVACSSYSWQNTIESYRGNSLVVWVLC